MKEFFNSRIGKCFLYTLLCVGFFMVFYGMFQFILNDFYWLKLSEQRGRTSLVILVVLDIFIAYLIGLYIRFR